MRFYEIFNDLSVNRWIVHGSLSTFPRLVNGVRWNIPSIDLSLRADGPKVDFSQVIWFPLVSRPLADLVESHSQQEIERVVTTINGIDKGFELIHVVWEVDCLDRENSVISDDGMIWKIVLDVEKISGRKIFRLAGTARIIVCDELADAIASEKFSGISFTEL